MDTPHMEAPRSPNPRRRPRSKMQIFKEAYLPTIILAVTIVMIVIFIIGAAVSGDPYTEAQPSVPTTTVPSTAQTDPTQSTAPLWLQQDADARLAEAEQLALNYEFAEAIALIEDFPGDRNQYPQLRDAMNRYQQILNSMVSWDAGDVVNLSFQLLIADPARAFADAENGSSYQSNHVTTSEFSAILQQLYDNGYVLVRMDDFYEQVYNNTTGRYVFTQKQLQLPAGKTPIMLTETNANYYTYMVDGNGDGQPDARGDGFACRLYHDETGFYNELVNADGSVSTGAYDVVPLLEAFIAANPDFSYKGARAIIAFSGYNGVLGYRINSTTLSADALQAERDGAAAIVQALRDAGYDLACYSYNNVSYGSDRTAAKVQEDIQKWLNEISPWIGALDMLVFARDSDIAGTETYSGNSKFHVLYNAGFTYFLGVGTGAWNQVQDQYVRHNRMNVSGYYLQNAPELFAGMFDAAAVLDSARA